MPTYEYVCTQCASPLEVVQSIHEPSLTHCPSCDGGKLRKLFGNVGVVFKGSGFYRTDSRSKSHGGRGSGSDKAATSVSAGASEGGSAAKASPSKESTVKESTTKESRPSPSAATSS